MRSDRVREHPIVRMAAADAGRLHRPRSGKVGRAEAKSVHPGRSGRNRLDIVDALRGLENRMDKNWPLEAVTRLEQSQILVDEMNIPFAFDFRRHHDVE